MRKSHSGHPALGMRGMRDSLGRRAGSPSVVALRRRWKGRQTAELHGDIRGICGKRGRGKGAFALRVDKGGIPQRVTLRR